VPDRGADDGQSPEAEMVAVVASGAERLTAVYVNEDECVKIQLADGGQNRVSIVKLHVGTTVPKVFTSMAPWRL
jgi:hypothetical protein